MRVVQGGQATLDRREDRFPALARHGVEKEAEKPA
jgi:hypothetical protein